MALPANAEVLDKMDTNQAITAKEAKQEPIEFENYFNSWIIFPVDAGFETMSSGFGYREQACLACSTNHQGIDFVMPRGSTIRAVFYGQVLRVDQYQGSFGTAVTIIHPELGGIQTVYAHMIQGSPIVKVGDSVVPGQKIGRVGNTGVTTAYHLHFGIYVDGYAIDPEIWLKSNKAKKFRG
jgi:murein DD-endopeptidase MepM/ murein hydrolase activator NlpD